MKIIIGFSTPKKFNIISWLIKKWLNTNYSHCYIKFELNSLNLNTIYQASKNMVHFKEENNFLEENAVIREFVIEVDSNIRSKLLTNSIKLAGESYGYFDFIQIALLDVLNKFKFNVNTYDRKGYICSELLGKFLSEDLGLKFDKSVYLLRPDDIYKKLEDYGKIEQK